MNAINADDFPTAVAIAFGSRGEFGIGAVGPLLDVWLGQLADDATLSIVVDPSTATGDRDAHSVLADVVAEAGRHRHGVRVMLSGERYAVEGSDAPHWVVDSCDIHAPALSLVHGASTSGLVAAAAPCAADCAAADLAQRP